MPKINWGGVLIGAVAGLGITAALAIVLFAAGIRPDDSTPAQMGFILVLFAGETIAGFVGGRFGRPTEPLHGSLSALALFAVSAATSLATGSDVSPAVIGMSALVAMVLGTAGGALAMNR
ncbi:MAG: hypothetical protein OEM22_01165 [Acidimicrobiia bacterium]|nr:hypothetical protein [Acidimicrobiia bacterium]MDH3470603.1 hypothetical protein [Acidimicrobiia bacterium]